MIRQWDQTDTDIFGMMLENPKVKRMVFAIFEDRTPYLVAVVGMLKAYVTEQRARDNHDKWCPHVVHENLVRPFLRELYADALFMAAYVEIIEIPHILGLPIIECVCDKEFREETLARIAKEGHDLDQCLDLDCILTKHPRRDSAAE